jgi:tetratricopeptide (TPR) repeat protein
MENSSVPENRIRNLLRVLRPLFWWGLLVLLLFGIRTHLRWMEKTRLYFNLTIQGKGEQYGQSLMEAGDTAFGATATFDGKTILTGQKIPLGNHTFKITHPKTEPFSTNLFVWYGQHNFGTVDLKRAQGKLTVTASPPVPLLSIRGPEFSVTLTNSAGLDKVVPTDEYTVTAEYRHWSESRRVMVFSQTGSEWKIAPRFGVLDLTCNQDGATFQLTGTDGKPVETGEFPSRIPDLPQGSYQLRAWHHNHQWNKSTPVVAGMTNTYRIEFQYGSAALSTIPAGATVTTPDGRDAGVTPLTLTELQPGVWKFNLRLNNYEPATVSLEISANQTNTLHTNLVSQSYSSSMRAARQSMNAKAYDDASRFLTDALRAQPNDAAATALLMQADSLGSIARATALGKQGDYISGIKELEKALTAMPDDERAKQMLAEFKQHEPEQRARMVRENSETLTNVFNEFTGKITGAASVERRELSTPESAQNLRTALVHQFTAVEPIFRISKSGWTNETFFMDFDQEVSGGGRLCMIVATQIKEGETRLFFKNIEYKNDAIGLKILGAVVGTITSTKFQSSFHPIDPTDAKLSDSDKKRIADGNQIITDRIQHAIGENSSPTTTPAANP